MITGVREFNLAIRKFTRKVTKNTERVTRTAMTDLMGQVINSTPVDTSQLIQNWRIGFDFAPTAFTEVMAPHGQSIPEWQGDMYNYLKNEIVAFNLGQKIFMMNNAPYSLEIEYGKSVQIHAMAGMVRVNVADWRFLVDSAARAIS